MESMVSSVCGTDPSGRDLATSHEPGRDPGARPLLLQRRGILSASGCLDDADRMRTIVCMRTTLNIDDSLLQQAREMTGESEKTKLIHLGLEALIQRGAAQRLAALGGTDRKATAGSRRRAAKSAR